MQGLPKPSNLRTDPLRGVRRKSPAVPAEVRGRQTGKAEGRATPEQHNVNTGPGMPMPGSSPLPEPPKSIEIRGIPERKQNAYMLHLRRRNPCNQQQIRPFIYSGSNSQQQNAEENVSVADRVPTPPGSGRTTPTSSTRNRMEPLLRRVKSAIGRVAAELDQARILPQNTGGSM